jgi:hypothetical protein
MTWRALSIIPYGAQLLAVDAAVAVGEGLLNNTRNVTGEIYRHTQRQRITHHMSSHLIIHKSSEGEMGRPVQSSQSHVSSLPSLEPVPGWRV